MNTDSLENNTCSWSNARNISLSFLGALTKTGVWVYGAYMDENNESWERVVCIGFGAVLTIAQFMSNITLHRQKMQGSVQATQPAQLSGSRSLDSITLTAFYEGLLLFSCLIKGVMTSWSVIKFVISFSALGLAPLRTMKLFWWTSFLFPYIPLSSGLTTIDFFRRATENQAYPRNWRESIYSNARIMLINLLWGIAFLIEKMFCIINGPGLSQAVGQIGALGAGFDEKNTVIMKPALTLIEYYADPLSNIVIGNAYGTLLYTSATVQVIREVLRLDNSRDSLIAFVLVGAVNFFMVFLGTNEGWFDKYQKTLKRVGYVQADKRNDEPCGSLRLMQYVLMHLHLKIACVDLNMLDISATVKAFQSAAAAAFLVLKFIPGFFEQNIMLCSLGTILFAVGLTFFSYHFDHSVSKTGNKSIPFNWAYFASFTQYSLFCCLYKPLTGTDLINTFGGQESFQQEFNRIPNDVRQRLIASFDSREKHDDFQDQNADDFVKQILGSAVV